MGDLFFVLKSFAITAVIVVLMQIKIGPQTIEQRSLSWLHQSFLAEQLQNVAEGAVKAGREGYRAVAGFTGLGSKRISSTPDEAGWIKFRHKIRESASTPATDDSED